MLDLRTLGGLDIASTGPLGKAASQPRRLALLAVLAEASERGVSRDALIGLLWPEQIAESARHNLTQTLYALRRDLGAEDLFTGTSRLALNPTLLGCDLWKFRRALQENDWDAAVKLYRGPFLSGVFINHTPEFDRWVEQARQNIAAEYARGIELLAGDLAARGEHAQAAALWRRLASFDPHNASVVMEIARQMRAAGDRAGALSIIHEFGTRLREDLALPLDAALIQLADSIRGELGHRPPPVVGQQVAAFHPDRASGAQEVRRGHPIHLSPLRRKRQLLVLAAGGLAVATVLVVSAGRNRPISSPSGTTSVAVLPFEVHGDSAAGFLRDGMARLVAQGLDGVGRVRAALYPTVGPLLDRAESAADTSGAMGRRFRIDRYVAGDVTLVGTTIQVRAVLHDVSKRGATLGTALVTGSRDSLF
ncbi:MAG TPA: BTAD domain-containing putative transcriptional regulator, partial [Gemmatimonadales bacterium]|nr:BTAD domain-containing putative transcriptional regulator [Gemmatimonadales bacterium]